MTSARTGHKAIAVNRYLYVVGGNNGLSTLSTVEYAEINIDGTLGTWQTAHPLTTARMFMGLTAGYGYIYAIGGRNPGALNSVEYAPIGTNGALGDWQTTSALNTARSGMDAVVAGGYIYVPSGQNESGRPSSVEYTAINTDGTLALWGTAGDVNPARSYHATISDGRSMYMIGGAAYSSNTGLANVEMATINSDHTLGAWQSAESLGQATYGIGAVFAKDHIYLTGGYVYAGYVSTVKYASVTPISIRSGRAVWVWDPTDIFHEQNGTKVFFDFLRAPHGNPNKQITTVYLQVPEQYMTDSEREPFLRTFLRAAYQEGIAVHYLAPGKGVSEKWVTSPNDFAAGRELIWKAFSYNKRMPHEDERFKGIHLDVEPAENTDWAANKDEYWDRFYELLWYVSQDVSAYNFDYPPIVFGVDLPTFNPWYGSDVDGNGKADYVDVLSYVDILTTMDYADHAGDYEWGSSIGSYGLITRVAPAIAEAQRIGKKVIVGAETLDIVSLGSPNLENWMTFYEEGWAVMEVHLDQVQSTYETNPGFGGIAIHFYSDSSTVHAYKCLQEFRGCDSDTRSMMHQTVHLNQGETKILTATVSIANQVTSFVTQWAGSTTTTSLVDPFGHVITAATAEADPNMRHHAGASFETYHISSPIEGSWQVWLYGADLPADGEDVTVEVYASGLPSYVYLPLVLR